MVDPDLRGQGIQFDGTVALGDRFVEPSLEAQCQTELIVREGVVGIEGDRAAEFALAPSQSYS